MRADLGQTDLVRAISDFLGQFAQTGILRNENEHGIDVLYSRKDAGLVRFRFVTFDHCEINIDVRLNEVDRDYLETMMSQLLRKLENHRTQRTYH